jgi:hypothetical protein
MADEPLVMEAGHPLEVDLRVRLRVKATRRMNVVTMEDAARHMVAHDVLRGPAYGPEITLKFLSTDVLTNPSVELADLWELYRQGVAQVPYDFRALAEELAKQHPAVLALFLWDGLNGNMVESFGESAFLGITNALMDLKVTDNQRRYGLS